jgi:hypothetical protein
MNVHEVARLADAQAGRLFLSQYREPTAADVGKVIEVRDHPSHGWRKALLRGISKPVGNFPWRVSFPNQIETFPNQIETRFAYARIEVSTVLQPEPVVKESFTTEAEDANSQETPNSSSPDVPEKITVGYTVQNAYDPNKDPETKPIQRKRVFYLAGPMRGRPYFNYQMFDRVRDCLLSQQRYEVISPADEDRKQDGFDPMVDPKYANPDNCVFPDSMDFPRVMRRCIDAVMRCDEIVMLPEWHTSAGAVAEFFLAAWAGKRVRFVYFDDQGEIGYASHPKLDPETSAGALAICWGFENPDNTKSPTDEDDLDDECGCSECSSQDIRQSDDVLAEAFKITRGDRQATYGPPDQDFRRTAGMWTALFGHMLKEGEAFEPRHVAMAMIQIKCSREIHQRKRDNWVDMAGYASCGSRCN